MDAVKVYSKRDCSACRATVLYLERHGLPYIVEDFDQSPEAQGLAQLHGFRIAPLCTFRGEIWAGFRPDIIADLK